MARECVRCVVTLALKELRWEEPPGSPLHLTGPPVFLRACVLGQLQYTPLLRPTFPLHLQRNLIFDRVLTNCSDPSLLKEIVTGEHVYIEMIQVLDDCEGGTILARYEAPADKFLFPEAPVGKLRTLALSKSRKYKHCPHLTLTTSISVTIHTPSPTPPSKPPSQVTPNVLKTESLPRKKVSGTTQDKLHLLLNSCTEPHPQQDPRQKQGKHKFWPPVRKTTSEAEEPQRGSRSSTGGRNFKVQRSLTSTPADLYHCCTASFGPHTWTTCPRRRFRKCGITSRNPKSPHPRSKSAPHQHQRELGGLCTPEEPLTAKQYPGPRQTSAGNRRPFVAGGVDPKLISKRDFCGQIPGRRRVERHGTSDGRKRRERRVGFLERHGSGERWEREGGVRKTAGERWEREAAGERWERERDVCKTAGERWGREGGVCETAGSTDTKRNERLEEEKVSRKDSLNKPHPTAPLKAVPNTTSISTNSDEDEDGTHISSCTSATSSDGTFSSSAAGRDGEESDVSNRANTESETCSRRQRHHLLSKYLQHKHGNGRIGTGSPARQIETKLNALIQECCKCRYSAESLGQDDMTEDNERLRASLSAEREDHFNTSTRHLPEKSILVGLGGDDYWSQRVAQFQGKHHRLVFDETMEKIYSRLYQNATNMN